MNTQETGSNPAEVKLDDLKKKYADKKVYLVNHTVQVDDETEEEFAILFRKPLPATYDRYIKTASKAMSMASKTFVLDNVVAEHKEKLEAGLEDYPAMSITFAEKLLKMLGLGDNTTVKKL